MLGHCLWFLSVLVGSVLAVAEFDDDPYLVYRPAFARSLPVQILLTGVVLTLTAVLFIHLLFTAQYHWPLAPVNYVLQLSGVTILLISLIATINVVLSAALSESIKWPYMLSYIAVNVPPLNLDPNEDGWSFSEKATWLLMTASTSGLIQITHIQFLTLLYPSKLEGRLIFTLLGPLAIVATVMQLLPIGGSPSANSISSAVRNVCNATLSLLFTVALFVWGFLVNRQQAWRTDGGTAVFGVAALVLAVISTALNFLYVHKEEEFVWLPALVWAVVLWQSFLGWWWWVGAGTGGGLTNKDEMEEKLTRRAKRETRKKEAERKRQKRKERAHQVWQGVAAVLMPPHSTPTAVSSSVQLNQSNGDDINLPALSAGESQTPQQRLRTQSSSHMSADEEDESTSPAAGADSRSFASRASSPTFTCETSGRTTSTAPRFIPSMVFRWYTSLRKAHIAAARQQAVERAERMRGIGQDRENTENSGTQDDSGRIAEGSRCDWFPWRNLATGRTMNEDNEKPGGDDIYPSDDPESNGAEERRQRQGRRTLNASEDLSRTSLRPNSFWWWGPLGRWRLQDSTTY